MFYVYYEQNYPVYFADWARIEAEEGGYVPTVSDYISHLIRYGFVEKVA